MQRLDSVIKRTRRTEPEPPSRRSECVGPLTGGTGVSIPVPLCWCRLGIRFDGEGPDMEGARRPHYQVTFGVLAVGIGAFALLQSLVIPVLSTVQVELHTSQSAVTWVLTAYLLSASVMTRSWGGSVTCSARSGSSWPRWPPSRSDGAGGRRPRPRGDDRGPVIQGLGAGRCRWVRDHPGRVPQGKGARRRRHPRGADRGGGLESCWPARS